MHSEEKAWRIWCERALILFGTIFYLFVFPHGTHGDGWIRYISVEALATRGEWLVHKYPMIGPFCSVPLYWLGMLVKEPHWWVSRFNSFCFLGFLAVLYRLLRSEVPNASWRRRLILLLLAGTMFSKHVTDFYGEVFTSCLAALSIAYILLRNRSAGIFTLAVAAASTPATLLATGLVSLRISWIVKRWRYFLPPILGLLFMLSENFLRFGTLVNQQYFLDEALTKNALPYAKLNGFHYPFFFGVLSICFSFGKGIAFYCSGLLAMPFAMKHLPEKLRELQRVWALYVLGLILIYAKWCAWPGDWYWGPRYFLFAGIPAALALHTLLEKKREGLVETIGALTLLTLSVWVGLDGVAFGQNNLEDCGVNGGYLMGFCWYTPEYSALWRPFLAEKFLNGKQTAFTVYYLLVYCFLSFPLWKYLAGETYSTVRKAAADSKRILREWRF
jgi:hypothetical protein